MQQHRQTLIDLETKFWQSMVDQDVDTAVDLLVEPALTVSAHGIRKFDRDGYRQMADQGPMVLTSFELSDFEVLFPNEATAVVAYRARQGVCQRGRKESTVQEVNDTSTWVRDGDTWRCVMHSETPVNPPAAAN